MKTNQNHYTKALIHTNGTIQYRNHNGKHHRTNAPAIIYADGREEYKTNGELHRTDGPAIIYSDGSEVLLQV